MKIRTIAATAVLTTALVAGGSIAASAAPSIDSTDSDSTSTCLGERLVTAWRHLPDDLKQDLKDVKATEPGERGSAVREIRESARDGQYGPEVQQRADTLQARRIQMWANMPAALRSDLNEVRLADPADRRDLSREIADVALAGGYGEKTQLVAVNIQSSLCHAPS